jgi:dTDP-4-amino-4,6-dideoxygalactose transaminase
MNLKPGDEIIASPVSCLASNQPFVTKNLKINWVDIDPTTGTICLEDLSKKISNKTKAVFVNYFCGYVGNCREIYEIVKKHSIYLIDDAIEAFGAEFNNKRVGNLYSDATIFSFQTVRLPNTIEGGGIAFKNIDLFERSTIVRDYGIDRKNFRDKRGEISEKCDIKVEGFGALMPEINSIIGLNQIKELENLLKVQRENALEWTNKLQNNSDLRPLGIVKGANPNFWVFGLLAKNKGETLDLFREKGFYSSSVHINNNIYSVFKNQEGLPGVTEFMGSFLAIPSGWWVDKQDIRNLLW